MKKTTIVFSLLLAIAVGLYGASFSQLQAPMNQVLEDDPRNKGVEVSVHYGSYLDPSTLVYNLEDVSDNNSRADVFRVLLQFADKIQDKDFDVVELAYQGETRFILEGDYFQKLGAEYDSQNPVYTMRTMPENLKTPDGQKAFSSWSGGLLGVLNQQMEDFNSFHDHWYMNEVVLGK